MPAMSPLVVIVPYRAPSPRQGRQFSWATGGLGQFPASTVPLVPVASTGNYLCLTPSG